MNDDVVPIQLNMDDAFERSLASIVETNRRKRRDYAQDGSPWSNFDGSSYLLGIEGFGRKEAAYFNVCQKIMRLRSLRANGRMNDTSNESVGDTMLDLAVYSAILYAMAQEEAE